MFTKLCFFAARIKCLNNEFKIKTRFMIMLKEGKIIILITVFYLTEKQK